MASERQPPKIENLIYDNFVHYRSGKGDEPWTCAEALRVYEKGQGGGVDKRLLEQRKKFGVFDVITKQSGWSSTPLDADDAIGAIDAYNRLLDLSVEILTIPGRWTLKVKTPDFMRLLEADVLLSFVSLNERERIESLTAIVARVAKLYAAGSVVLSLHQEKLFEHALASIVLGTAVESAIADFAEIQKQFGQLSEPDEIPEWEAPELWRSIDKDESAQAYFARFLEKIPYHLRPSTTEIRSAQPEFYKALSSYCSDLKGKRDKDFERIVHISQLLPIGPPRAPRQQPVKSLPEHWRSVNKDESAAAYFERVIAPIPFALRPTTKQIGLEQPDLYRALRNVCADQKRYNRKGEGEVGRARALSELMPLGAQRPPRRSGKPADDLT